MGGLLATADYVACCTAGLRKPGTANLDGIFVYRCIHNSPVYTIYGEGYLEPLSRKELNAVVISLQGQGWESMDAGELYNLGFI